MKQLRKLKEGNSRSLKLPQKKERGRIRGSEDGGISEVLEEAVIVFFLLPQTVSSYVLLLLLSITSDFHSQDAPAGIQSRQRRL